MFLSLETDSNITSFRMKAMELSLSQKLPHAAAQKLKELLTNDNISIEESTIELEKILASSETISSKTIVYLSNLKARFLDQVLRISPFQVGFILLLFMLLFFLYKKYISKSKKRSKYLFNLIENVVERFYASLAYFLAVVVFYSNNLARLCLTFPRLNLLYPEFMQAAVSIYITKANLIGWVYVFIIFFLIVRYKKPRSRFVRFHVVRGFIIMQGQFLVEQLVSFIMGPIPLLKESQQISVLMFLSMVNLYFILPSITQALRHTYPKNSFLREATELILGRDDEPGFKWWDRDY